MYDELNRLYCGFDRELAEKVYRRTSRWWTVMIPTRPSAEGSGRSALSVTFNGLLATQFRSEYLQREFSGFPEGLQKSEYR